MINIFKIIPLEVFGHDVVVSIGQTDEDLYEEIKENTSKKDFDKWKK